MHQWKSVTTLQDVPMWELCFLIGPSVIGKNLNLIHLAQKSPYFWCGTGSPPWWMVIDYKAVPHQIHRNLLLFSWIGLAWHLNLSGFVIPSAGPSTSPGLPPLPWDWVGGERVARERGWWWWRWDWARQGQARAWLGSGRGIWGNICHIPPFLVVMSLNDLPYNMTRCISKKSGLLYSIL